MEIIREKPHSLDKYLLVELLKCRAEGIKDFLVPAGGTPESFYGLFRSAHSTHRELSQLKLWQIDEIISGPLKGHFTQFFKDNLGKFFHQLVKVEETPCGPKNPYVSFLGLGVNGHVAFHEPHIPENFSFGCVELGDETLSYLKLKGPCWGLTFGLETFLKSERIFLMVKGKHKSDILRRFMNDDPSVPAVHLKKHKRITLLLDNEVSFELSKPSTLTA